MLLMPGWWNAISAASLIDRHENTPATLANAERVACPSLFVVGGDEAASIYPAEEFAQRTPGPCTVRIIEGGDHWYTGRRELVTAVIGDWLNEVLGPMATS